MKLIYFLLALVVAHSYAAGPTPPVVTTEPATGITQTFAEMNARVTTTGAPNFQISIFWGLYDGDTNANDWEHTALLDYAVTNGEVVTYRNSELLAGSNYFYRGYATNDEGEAWAPSSTNFTTTTLHPEWIDPVPLPFSYIANRHGDATNASFIVSNTNSTDVISLIAQNAYQYYSLMTPSGFLPSLASTSASPIVAFSWDSIFNCRYLFYAGTSVATMASTVATTQVSAVTNTYNYGDTIYWRVTAQNLFSRKILTGDVLTNYVRSLLLPGTPNIYYPVSPNVVAYNLSQVLYWYSTTNTSQYLLEYKWNFMNSTEPGAWYYCTTQATNTAPAVAYFTAANNNTSGNSYYYWYRVVSIGIDPLSRTSNTVRIELQTRPPLPTGASSLTPTTFTSGVNTYVSFNPGSYGTTYDVWTYSPLQGWLKPIAGRNVATPWFYSTWTGLSSYCKYQIDVKNAYGTVTRQFAINIVP